MTEVKPSSGVLAIIMSVVTMLAQIWGAIPQASRDKLVATIVDGFEGMLRRYFRRYHGLDVKPGQEVAS